MHLMGSYLLAKDSSFLHAEYEDSDQTGRMPRLIRVFTGCTCHFVGFVMRHLNLCLKHLMYNGLKLVKAIA